MSHNGNSLEKYFKGSPIYIVLYLFTLCYYRTPIGCLVSDIKNTFGEFPGDLVVRTPCFHCCSWGSIPGPLAWDLRSHLNFCTSWPKKKIILHLSDIIKVILKKSAFASFAFNSALVFHIFRTISKKNP